MSGVAATPTLAFVELKLDLKGRSSMCHIGSHMRKHMQAVVLSYVHGTARNSTELMDLYMRDCLIKTIVGLLGINQG